MSDDTLLGEIQAFPFMRAPLGWYPCNGQILPIQDYRALHSLLGNRFGGDGKETFGLPDLRGKAPLPGVHYFICVDGYYPHFKD